MVLKSLGKKIKSLGKSKKDKNEDVPPPKKVGKSLEKGGEEPAKEGLNIALHGWKGGAPSGEKKSEGPTIGKKQTDKPKHPSKPAPKKWVKGDKSDKDKGPMTIGKKSGKGGGEKPGQLGGEKPGKGGGTWTKGGKGDTSSQGPFTIGGKRGESTKGKAPKDEAPKEDPKNKYLTSGSNYTTNQNPYTTSSQNPYTTESKDEGGDEAPKNKYLVGAKNNYGRYVPGEDSDGGDGRNEEIDPETGNTKYTMSGGVDVSRRYAPTFIPLSVSDPFSTTSSSDDEPIVTPAQLRGEFYSEGTSAFQHSGQAPGEGEEKKKDNVEDKKEGVSEGSSNEDDSDSVIDEQIGAAIICKYTTNGYGTKYDNPVDKVEGGDGGEQVKKYLQNGGEEDIVEKVEKGEQGGDDKGEVGGKPGGNSNDTNYTQDNQSGPNPLTPGNEGPGEVGDGNQGGPPNKYLMQGGEGSNYNKYTTQGGGTNYNKYTTEGASNYSNYGNLNRMMGMDMGGPRSMLSISTSSSVKSESEEAPKKQPEVRKGELTPEVQGKTEEHRDEKVAKMQEKLRGESHRNKDVDERVHGTSVKVNRLDKSKNEQESKGWSTIAMRDNYRNRVVGQRIVKGLDRDLMKNGQPTQYFISKGDKLEYEARKILAANLKEGRGTKREDTVIRFVGGKFVNAKDEVVDTTNIEAMNYTINEFRDKLGEKIEDIRFSGLDKKLAKLQEQLQGISKGKTVQETMRKVGLAGRAIFVMNAAGEFFAGKSMPGIIHHSSFMAGGAVACAGEVAISGGTLTAISNTSGHYRPGPVYLWQACKQLELLGCPLGSVRVDVMGVKKSFKSAAEFLGAMDPVARPEMFDSAQAIKHLNDYFSEKQRNKNLEKETMEKGEESKDDNQTQGQGTH